MSAAVVAVLLALVLVGGALLVAALPRRVGGCFPAARRAPGPRRVMAVLGSGGHTTEMLALLPALTGDADLRPLLCVVADTDATSRERARAAGVRAIARRSVRRPWRPRTCPPNSRPVPLAGSEQIGGPSVQWLTLPRAREVGQSWLSTPWSAARAALAAAVLVATQAPDLLLVNGPGTCVPVALAALLWRAVGLVRTRVVFVESVCRVHAPSLSGRLLLPVADRFLVQWPELHGRLRGWGVEYLGLLL
jgi:beta-1,4-N-acetylglucosaminyltransferase